MKNKAGKFMGVAFCVWQDSKYPIFYWSWGGYGGQVETLAKCWESIGRAAGIWEKDSEGNWIHSSKAIAS